VLDEVQPKVWRQMTVPASITLDHLHDCLQVVMGWTDYHVCEKIQDCAKAMFGVGLLPAKTWATAKVEELMQLQGPKFIEALKKDRKAAPDEKSRDALDALIGYLTHNRDSLWYRTRLAQGLPIGSGLVEGTCKNMIGKRLKLNNPAWLVPRAVNMAALRCLHYSKMWDAYWESKRLSKAA
jgi:Plasmid pRiA4b ORF-3-like protein